MQPREKILLSPQTQPRLTRLLIRRVQETPQVYRSRSPEMDISDIVKRNLSVTYVGNFIIECLGDEQPSIRVELEDDVVI